MSYLIALPEYVTAAATDLANIGSTISGANAAAAGPTSQLLAAGADDVSTAIASLFSGHAKAFQALSADAAAFHQQFVQLMNTAAGEYLGAEAANASPLRSVTQELQALVNAPVQSLLGSTPAAALSNLGSNLSLSGLQNILTSGLSNLGIKVNLSSVALPTGALSNIEANLAGLVNLPHNLVADIANIPYYESLALQEYAYALGPAGTVGGVAGWIPPGATVANGGAVSINGLLYYAQGGTGSWYMESIGNTWGWDNGNWPQVDAFLHIMLPFSFTESLAENFQTFAQAELIDGAHLNTEFEAAQPAGYLLGWLHGATPITSLISGTTFPTVLTDTVGQNVGSIINVGPTGTEQTAIWSGQAAQWTPGSSINAVATNLTQSPSQNPIMLPSASGVLSSFETLAVDEFNDFNPFATGSFVYWGAPTLYSLPDAIGGAIQDVTGIPNQFAVANYGAETVSGYTAGPSSVLTGLPAGAQYFEQGLQGYLDPSIYVQAFNNDVAVLSHPAQHLGAIPLIGYLGID